MNRRLDRNPHLWEPSAIVLDLNRGLPSLRLQVGVAAMVALLLLGSGCAITSEVPRWSQFETTFTAENTTDNPPQDTELFVTFNSPSRQSHTVRGFWDGGDEWRVRFAPGEEGQWTFVTHAVPADGGLHDKAGTFRVSAPSGSTRFDAHGPVRVSASGTFLEHADGTPFFWLADTGWNAALKSTSEEWSDYLDVRSDQGFTAIQWVATQWRAAPDGDRLGQRAFTGHERIEINAEFFQRLDEKVEALESAGLLNVPVLLWAIGSGSDPSVNPGVSLPEDQAVLLAQYMVARWQGQSSVWILAGDGDYRGELAERWKRIGREVFADVEHAPALMHPGGMHWVHGEFLDEDWVDIHGYQSGHGDDVRTLRWMTDGPPSRDWDVEPLRPFINLEPPYENHIAYQSGQPISAAAVRRAVYWSLLNTPTAGVSYGGHGVWGWDDGSGPPVDHAGSGTPLPWREALEMPGARQMRHVADLFSSIAFWRLRPAQEALLNQPGVRDVDRFIAVAATPDRDLLVAYTPQSTTLAFHTDELPRGVATWINPGSGDRTPASAVDATTIQRFEPPGDGDWVLIVSTPEG